MLRGTVKRTDDFREEPSVVINSASLSDYKGIGFDRGYLCPATDMIGGLNSRSQP
jgi:DNA/RNA endonuclease G (NUC1)